MVYMLNSSSDYDAHVWSLSGNLICLRHLFTLTAVSVFSEKGPIFLHFCQTLSKLPSNVSTMCYCPVARVQRGEVSATKNVL